MVQLIERAPGRAHIFRIVQQIDGLCFRLSPSRPFGVRQFPRGKAKRVADRVAARTTD